MAHRVVEIAFNPSSALQWRIHGAVRQEWARLWGRMARLHAFIRRLARKADQDGAARLGQ